MHVCLRPCCKWMLGIGVRVMCQCSWELTFASLMHAKPFNRFSPFCHAFSIMTVVTRSFFSLQSWRGVKKTGIVRCTTFLSSASDFLTDFRHFFKGKCVVSTVSARVDFFLKAEKLIWRATFLNA